MSLFETMSLYVQWKSFQTSNAGHVSNVLLSGQVTKRARFNDITPSSTGMFLMQEVGGGYRSIRKASQIAQCVQEDGCVAEDIAGWASLGGAKHAGSRMERDLVSWTKNAFGFQLELSWMEITVWDKETTGTKNVQWPYIEPWLLLHELGTVPQQIRRSSVPTGFDSKMLEFWSHCNKHCKWMSNHPMGGQESAWQWTIPLRSHGDAARFCQNSKLLILSSSSILARGSSWNTKLIFTLIPHELLVAGVTLRQLLTQMGKSMHQLCSMSGQCPHLDVHGQEFPKDSRRWQLRGHRICHEFTLARIGMKGDNEWVVQVTETKRHYSANRICRRCFASKTQEALLYADVSANPGWLYTMQSTQHYLWYVA